jgi:hypothetical protein
MEVPFHSAATQSEKRQDLDCIDSTRRLLDIHDLKTIEMTGLILARLIISYILSQPVPKKFLVVQAIWQP